MIDGKDRTPLPKLSGTNSRGGRRAVGFVCCAPPKDKTSDCKVNYVSWSACSRKCGGGYKSRTNTITEQPSFFGKRCPKKQDLKQSQSCNTHACDIELKDILPKPDAFNIQVDWSKSGQNSWPEHKSMKVLDYEYDIYVYGGDSGKERKHMFHVAKEKSTVVTLKDLKPHHMYYIRVAPRVQSSLKISRHFHGIDVRTTCSCARLKDNLDPSNGGPRASQRADTIIYKWRDFSECETAYSVKRGTMNVDYFATGPQVCNQEFERDSTQSASKLKLGHTYKYCIAAADSDISYASLPSDESCQDLVIEWIGKVSGKVTTQSGSPVAHTTVKAYVLGLDRSATLKETKTAKDGSYSMNSKCHRLQSLLK